MPDLAITAATAITGANTASGDLFPIVDVSASTPKGRSITRDELGTAMVATSALTTALAAKLDLAGGTMTGALAINAGIATASANPLTITQTWNNAAVSFQGPKITITDTASAVNEQYFGIYAGAAGTTKVLSVEKIGGSNVVEVPSLRSTSNTWSLDFSEVGLAFGSARKLSWSSTVNYYDSKDVVLCRAAAATLQLGDNHATTATAQTIKAHNVTTGSGADLVLTGGTGSVNEGMVKLSNCSGDVRLSVGDDGIGFFAAAPQPQATTFIAGGSHTPGSGTGVTDDSTFEGYTIGQIVAGLRSFGLFA